MSSSHNGAVEIWRQAMQGESLIDGMVTPLGIAETPYNHRIAGYDEATLTRMLVFLRRSSIVALGQEPA